MKDDARRMKGAAAAAAAAATGGRRKKGGGERGVRVGEVKMEVDGEKKIQKGAVTEGTSKKGGKGVVGRAQGFKKPKNKKTKQIGSRAKVKALAVLVEKVSSISVCVLLGW